LNLVRGDDIYLSCEQNCTLFIPSACNGNKTIYFERKEPTETEGSSNEKTSKGRESTISIQNPKITPSTIVGTTHQKVANNTPIKNSRAIRQTESCRSCLLVTLIIASAVVAIIFFYVILKNREDEWKKLYKKWRS